MPETRLQTVFKRRKSGSQVLKDRPDLRDLDYKPTLNPLRAILMPPLPLVRGDMAIRSQQDAATNESNPDCTAQALAGLWDVLKGGEPVSAGMLFRRGHEVEHAELARPANEPLYFDQGLQSLRSIIKGLYHNGVCSEKIFAATRSGDVTRDASKDLLDIAFDARSRPLGSYYRLKPILNDYHAALNEVDAIYVAAEIHPGWDTGALVRTNGQIEIPGTSDLAGSYNHAFVIVGYNERGFLVLNSWGPEWGMYPLTAGERQELRKQYPDRGDGEFLDRLPGVALWTYRDWAERIIDGWVLRFGVSAPDAFEYSYGEHGIGAFMSGRIAAKTTPRHEVMGHYVHLDDGAFVKGGSFPSSVEDIEASVIRINQGVGKAAEAVAGGAAEPRTYKDVLVWIAGGSDGSKEVVASIAATKEYWKSAGVYPITVFWCSDFIEKATQLLSGTFAQSMERVGRQGVELDARIEQDCRGPGRAFWRDVKRSAWKAAQPRTLHNRGEGTPPGGLWQTFKELRGMADTLRLHVVAEGAGALALGELPSNELRHIASLTLLAPACTERFLEKDILRWRSVAGGDAGRPGGTPPIRLLALQPSVERRLSVGVYSGSILSLVQMAFEEVVPKRDPKGKGELRALNPATRDNRIIGLPDAARLAAKHHPADIALETLGHPGREAIKALREVTFAKSTLDVIKAAIVDMREDVGLTQNERGMTKEGTGAASSAVH